MSIVREPESGKVREWHYDYAFLSENYASLYERFWGRAVFQRYADKYLSIVDGQLHVQDSNGLGTMLERADAETYFAGAPIYAPGSTGVLDRYLSIHAMLLRVAPQN